MSPLISNVKAKIDLGQKKAGLLSNSVADCMLEIGMIGVLEMDKEKF